MKLVFRALRLRNFKSFREHIELEYPDDGLYFVRGLTPDNPRMGGNGAGKTTLFSDAVCWCLYGRTPALLRNPDVTPWGSTKATEVELTIEIDGKPHRIKRSTKPNSLTLDRREVKQEAIASLIGIDQPVFCVTVLWPQSRPMFLDMAPAQKMQLFNEVLNLSRWEDRSSAASSEAQERARALAKVEGEIEGTIANRRQLADMIDGLSRDHDQWEVDRAKKLLQFKADLKEWSSVNVNAEKAYNEAYTKWDFKLTELRKLEDDRRTLEKKLRTAQQKESEALALIQSATHDHQRYTAQLDALKTTKKCPTCGQSIRPENLEVHRRELLASVHGRNNVIKRGVPADVRKELKEVGDQLDAIDKDVDQFSDDLDKLERERDAARTRWYEAKAKVDAAQAGVREWDVGENPHASQLAEMKRARREAKTKLEDLRKRAGELERDADRAKFWITGFKDVRLYVIEELLSSMEAAGDTALDELGLTGWQIRWSVERETQSGTTQRGLNAQIITPGSKDPVKWEAYSGGESQRLKLAASMALSEVLLSQAGIEITMEVIDEPTRGLSPEGIIELVDCLSMRARQLKRTIILIDQHAIQTTRVDGTYTVTHDKNGSTVQ